MSTSPNIGSKGILAQLLASEGLSVRHDPKARTASFDIQNRTLILPIWKDMSNEIYDMLVGHEVGHALFTPFSTEKEAASNHKGNWSVEAQEIGGDSHGHIAMAYLNIVEDARIERLMKEKFRGLKRDFIAGYKQLNDKDIFEIKNNPPTELMDRINIYFKMGVSAQTDIGVKFNSVEQELVNRISVAESFDDVVQIVKDIWEYESKNCKQRQKAPKPTESTKQKAQGNGSNGEEEFSSTKSRNGQGGSNCAPDYFNPTAPRTQDAFNKKANEMVDTAVTQCSYATLPNIHLENIIITPKEIEKIIADYEVHIRNTMQTNHSEFAQSSFSDSLAIFHSETLNKAKEFIKSSQRSVAVMVKQFEMKKAADQHKRTRTTKTGILDCVKMMKYHFDEDIFRRNITIQKGKNHGFVMFIDWSGSMGGVIEDTVKQCFMIALFCKKCNIPFEVYAFSSGHIRKEIQDAITPSIDLSTDKGNPPTGEYPCFTDAITGDVLKYHSYYKDSTPATVPSAFFEDFSLLNFVSSTMSMKEMTAALQNIMKILGRNSSIDSSVYSFTPRSLGLGGTPLNCAIYAANKIVNEFRKKHNIQVMNTVFLTDGANCGSSFRLPSTQLSSYLIDTKKKKTIDLRKLLFKKNKITYCTDTKALLLLHAVETGSNTIGFYLHSGSTLRSNFISSINPTAYGNPTNESSLNSKFKKDGFCIATPDSPLGGYKELYIVRSSSLSEVEDDMMDKVVAGSSVTKVRAAFRKQMKAESVNKNLLNRFVEMVASN